MISYARRVGVSPGTTTMMLGENTTQDPGVIVRNADLQLRGLDDHRGPSDFELAPMYGYLPVHRGWVSGRPALSGGLGSTADGTSKGFRVDWKSFYGPAFFEGASLYYPDYPSARNGFWDGIGDARAANPGPKGEPSRYAYVVLYEMVAGPHGGAAKYFVIAAQGEPAQGMPYAPTAPSVPPEVEPDHRYSEPAASHAAPVRPPGISTGAKVGMWAGAAAVVGAGLWLWNR